MTAGQKSKGRHKEDQSTSPLQHKTHGWGEQRSEQLLFERKTSAGLGEEEVRGGRQQRKLEENPREREVQQTGSKVALKTAGWG